MNEDEEYKKYAKQLSEWEGELEAAKKALTSAMTDALRFSDRARLVDAGTSDAREREKLLQYTIPELDRRVRVADRNITELKARMDELSDEAVPVAEGADWVRGGSRRKRKRKRKRKKRTHRHRSKRRNKRKSRKYH